MFRAVSLPIIISFALYTQQWYMSYKFADSLRASSQQTCMYCCVYSEELRMMHVQRNCPKHVEFYSKINLRN